MWGADLGHLPTPPPNLTPNAALTKAIQLHSEASKQPTEGLPRELGGSQGLPHRDLHFMHPWKRMGVPSRALPLLFMPDASREEREKSAERCMAPQGLL